jgi:hypothetical protein
MASLLRRWFAAPLWQRVVGELEHGSAHIGGHHRIERRRVHILDVPRAA